jgi:hypothetical protein
MPGFLSGLFIGSTPGLLLLEFLTPTDFGPFVSIVIIGGLAITLLGVFKSRSLGGFISGLVVGLGLGIMLLGLI